LRIYAEAVRHNLSPQERTELDGQLRCMHVNTAVHAATIGDHIAEDAAGNDVIAIFLDTGPALFARDDENSNTQLQLFAASCPLLTEVLARRALECSGIRRSPRPLTT
jgi:hypothetical protein